MVSVVVSWDEFGEDLGPITTEAELVDYELYHEDEEISVTLNIPLSAAMLEVLNDMRGYPAMLTFDVVYPEEEGDQDDE